MTYFKAFLFTVPLSFSLSPSLFSLVETNCNLSNRIYESIIKNKERTELNTLKMSIQILYTECHRLQKKHNKTLF